MPGRGKYWKEGGLNDDTVISDDIKDGTISEADLDTALQTKVNTGGSYEKIGEFEVTTPQNTLPTGSLTGAPYVAGDVAEFLITCQYEHNNAGSTTIALDSDAFVGNTMGTVVHEISNAGAGSDKRVTGATVGAQNTQGEDESHALKITLYHPEGIGNIIGLYDETNQTGTIRSSRGSIDSDSPVSAINNFTLTIASGNFKVGSFIKVYKLLK